jgi:hypothetical protein
LNRARRANVSTLLAAASLVIECYAVRDFEFFNSLKDESFLNSSYFVIEILRLLDEGKTSGG